VAKGRTIRWNWHITPDLCLATSWLHDLIHSNVISMLNETAIELSNGRGLTQTPSTASRNLTFTSNLLYQYRTSRPCLPKQGWTSKPGSTVTVPSVSQTQVAHTVVHHRDRDADSH
jgi:hypothetical protein